MPIDWPKAEAKPEKKQTVSGRDLLQLRTKINNLERHLNDTKNELNRTHDQLKSNENDLEIVKDSLINADSLLARKKVELEEIKSHLGLTLSKLEEESEVNDNLISEIQKFNIEIENTNSKISELEHTKKELDSFVSNLSAELEHSISQIKRLGKSNVESNEQVEKLNISIKGLKNKLAEIQDENTILNDQLIELNNLLLQKDSKILQLSEKLEDNDRLIRGQSARLEEVESELSELQPLPMDTTSYPYETRITCPMCQAVGKDIREVEDKTRVLYYSGSIPIYAKMHVCKKCGYELK